MTIYCLISAVIPPTEDCDLIITSVTDLLVSPNAGVKTFTHCLSINDELTYVSEKIHVLLFSILGFLTFCFFFKYIYQTSNKRSVSHYSILLKNLPTLSNQKALFIFQSTINMRCINSSSHSCTPLSLLCLSQIPFFFLVHSHFSSPTFHINSFLSFLSLWCMHNPLSLWPVVI